MANPLPGKAAVDLGNGMAGTFYDDGTVSIWNINTGQLVANVRPGDSSYDLGTGQAATLGPQGLQVYDIGGQPNAGGFPGFNSGALAPPVGAAPTTITGTTGRPPQPSTWAQYSNLAYSPQNNWYDPATGRHPGWGSIGAGTQWTAPGYGVPGFGQAAIPITPENLKYLSDPKLAPGYIPGSGTYNQFKLNENLFATIGGQAYNTQYGSGGVGDPTTGLGGDQANALQTRFRNAGQQLFRLTGPNLENEYSPLGNLIGRAESPSGLSTASIPSWAGPLLVQAIQQGRLEPTAAGQQFMQEYFGIAPTQYGNRGGGGALVPGGGGGGAGGGGADQALQDYLASIQANAQAMQAAQLAYQDWYMRTQDDEQAFAHAQQEYENRWTEQMHAYQQQRDKWALQQSAGYFELDGQRTPTLQGIAQEAGLTGMYQGKPTFEREQYETGTMTNLLGLQAGLRGPENYSQYLKVLGSTPQGMRDVVNAAAGRFQMPSTSGVTPGQQTRPADVQSLLRDVTSGGAQAQADWSSALSGGLPNPNQFNLQNWSRMMPTQQKMLMSAYEGEGWDPADVQKMIQQSSPLGAVGGGGGMTGAFRF
jgi:hypothetical protein